MSRKETANEVVITNHDGAGNKTSTEVYNKNSANVSTAEGYRKISGGRVYNSHGRDIGSAGGKK